MRGRFFLIGAVLGLTAACLDPLYEDGDSAGWYVCCPQAVVDTCLCTPGQACLPNFTPCAGGACSAGPTCGGGLWDGGTAMGGGFGGGTGTGGSTGTGGGTGTGGSTGTDAGSVSPDAGSVTPDAGPATPDAGPVTQDAGAPADAGPATPPVYEVCCQGGRVSTCACANAICDHVPYTACPRGACVGGTTTGRCP